jgi:hypothetical protein
MEEIDSMVFMMCCDSNFPTGSRADELCWNWGMMEFGCLVVRLPKQTLRWLGNWLSTNCSAESDAKREAP